METVAIPKVTLFLRKVISETEDKNGQKTEAPEAGRTLGAVDGLSGIPCLSQEKAFGFRALGF